MRLRLTRFVGLRLRLARGWYLVPSHMAELEIGHLLDVLRDGLDGVTEVIELAEHEWPEFAPTLAPTSLVYLKVPGERDPAELEARVKNHDVRLGLIHLPNGRCWPTPAWDELEVKPALLSWFRAKFSRPEHPLCDFGIANFPFELVAGATTNPSELIELIDHAIEHAPLRQGQPVDWTGRVLDSIGAMLARRLLGFERAALDDLVSVLMANGDGHLRASQHRTATELLERAGLAIRVGDDVLLGPLARSVHVPEVRLAWRSELCRAHPSLAACFDR